MLALSSSTSMPPNSQLSTYMYQFKLQQARQEAAQAQNEVRMLEDETRRARREANQANDKLRAVEDTAPQQRPVLNTLGQVTGGKLNVTA